jgi:hypothetical protein
LCQRLSSAQSVSIQIRLNASPTIGWIPVPFQYQTNATPISITVPMPSGNAFYSLRKP